MNYRHAYHAGNFADVLKHAVLTLLLAHLRRKEAPFCVLDTHAGAGLYDLTSDEAGRTGEAEDGVRRLLDSSPLPPLLAGYEAALRAADPDLVRYPGSPMIAASLLRPDDRLVAVEMHPEDFRTLHRHLGRDKRVALHEGDGYGMLGALLPPRERRGLVLIDPPYEAETEFSDLLRGLQRGLAKWPTGIYAIWYPITRRAPAERFLAELPSLGRPALAAELRRAPEGTIEGLIGCGMALLNPPWKLDEDMAALLPELQSRLCPTGSWDMRWLAPPL